LVLAVIRANCRISTFGAKLTIFSNIHVIHAMISYKLANIFEKSPDFCQFFSIFVSFPFKPLLENGVKKT